jgi:O-antigen/teichoic acid export membrane protein
MNPKVGSLNGVAGPPPGLRKNFLWMVSGTVVSATFQVVVLALIQKMMGTESLGDYVFALSVSYPVFLFTGLSLNRMMVIDTEDSHGFHEYLGVRYFLCLVSVLLVTAIMLAGGHGVRLTLIGVLVAGYHSIYMSETLVQAVFQKHEFMRYIGLSNILQSATSLGSMAAGFYCTGSLFGGLIFLCVCSALKYGLYDLRIAQRFVPTRPRFDAALLGQILNKCWVISLSAGMVSVTGNLPRYLIKSQMDTESLGFFTGISTTTMGMALVVVALVASALRRLAVYYRQDSSSFGTLLMKLGGIGLGFGILNLLFTVVAGRYFLILLFDATYVAYLNTMCIFSIAGILLALVSIFGETIISTRHYGWRIAASIGSIAALFIAGHAWIPRQGLNGVAAACIVGFGVELLICIIGLMVLFKQQRAIPLSNSTG